MTAPEYNNGARNFVKLNDDSLERLLAPIPNKIIREEIAKIRGWEKKRLNFKENQTKVDYFKNMLGNTISLTHLRYLRSIREHSRIGEFSWKIYSWDKNLSRYYSFERIEEKVLEVIKDSPSIVNIDQYIVDRDKEIVFLLMERWGKEVVADTFLSQIETNIPRYFRAYLILSKNKLLVQAESKNLEKEFLEIFQNAFELTIQPEKITSLTIRHFVKKYREYIKRLVVRVPQEVAGFHGLSEFRFIGDDVIGGARGLLSRHDTSPIEVGPWTGASNKGLEIDVAKPVRLKEIHEILWLLDFLNE
ncbi:MAG: hypothetical protein U9O98_06080 [Asgard group archaeon]|nr:hypothetical protein [Asgard group archaeon]